MIKERRSDEESVAVGVDLRVASVHYQGRTGRFASVDVTRYSLLGLCCDNRAHVTAPGAIPRPQAQGAFLDFGYELVGDVADRQQHRYRHAALPRGAKASVDGLVRGKIKVGVRQYQRVILGTAQSLHTLAVGCARLIDVPGDRGGSHKGDRLDIRM